MKKGGKGVQGVIGSWSRVKTLNIYWPHLSRELIILQLNIRTIPSGWDLFLPLSERNKRFIAGQLTALVKLRENLNAYFFFFLFYAYFFAVELGAGKAKNVIDLSSISREEQPAEEEKQEIGQEEREIREKRACECYWVGTTRASLSMVLKEWAA